MKGKPGTVSSLLLIIVLVFFTVLFSKVFAYEAVELGCSDIEHCGVDPCKIASEKCRDQGGPLQPPSTSTTQSKPSDSSTSDQKPDQSPGGTHGKEQEDPCKWCICTSGTTIHPSCKECCP